MGDAVFSKGFSETEKRSKVLCSYISSCSSIFLVWKKIVNINRTTYRGDATILKGVESYSPKGWPARRPGLPQTPVVTKSPLSRTHSYHLVSFRRWKHAQPVPHSGLDNKCPPPPQRPHIHFNPRESFLKWWATFKRGSKSRQHYTKLRFN